MPNIPSANAFKLSRGASYILRFPIDKQVLGDPASGYATTYTVRESEESPVYVLRADGAWNSDESTVDVPITRAQTLALAPGAYVASLFRTDAGREDALSRDKITVVQGIYDAP